MALRFWMGRRGANPVLILMVCGSHGRGLGAILKMEAPLVAKNLGGQAVDSTKIENYLGLDFITRPD